MARRLFSVFPQRKPLFPATRLAWLSAVLVPLLLIVGSGLASSQALDTERLPNGTLLVVVTTPGATATSLAWPRSGTGTGPAIQTLTRGDLGLIADAEAAFGDTDPAPPVVVAVGAAEVTSLRNMLQRVFSGRAPAGLPQRREAPLVEGDVERRLEPPGTAATLRLILPLPPRGSVLRAPAEVLGEMIPRLVTPGVPSLRSRLKSHTLILETNIDAANGDEMLSRLRLALAQLSGAPQIDPAIVDEVRTRLEVRRTAHLEEMPSGAETLVSIWLDAGLPGVREYLFGMAGVTPAGVRRAMSAWLAVHPGHAVLLLPPQSLNPRFATPPRAQLLADGINTVILERPGSDLAALDLMPVLVPDLDAQGAALVLTQLAATIRDSAEAPGWIRVFTDPPSLELATVPGNFPQLCEVLSEALQKTGSNGATIRIETGARHRALQLMAVLLGFPDTHAVSPARLLKPSNLAVGAVVPDAGTAGEAMAKFLATLGGQKEGVHTQEISAAPETRAPVPGHRSVLVVALPVDAAAGAPAADVAVALVVSRLRELIKDARVSILHPAVPGTHVVLLEIERDGTMDALDALAKKLWRTIVRAPSGRELEPVEHAVAAGHAAGYNGATGAARLCAAQAAGAGLWRPTGSYERLVIGVEAKDLEPLLEAWKELTSLHTTGAGPFPASGLPPAAR